MANERWRRAAAVSLRVLLAALFVFSAVAKLMAIDAFELYIYSYGWLPLDVAFVAARLCIGAELVLAALIAAGCWPRLTRLLTLGMLLFFSLFLGYAALAGRNESCQCFGSAVDMPPTVSLLKNAVIILLVLVYYRLDTSVRRPAPRWGWLVAAMGCGLMAVPFVVSVPDSWMFGPERQRYDEALMQQTLAERGLDEGNKVVAFVTPGCPYCRMTREKLTSMAKRNDLDTANIVYLAPDDLGVELFLGITYGQRPLVVLLADGQTLATYHYRNINERQIALSLSRR